MSFARYPNYKDSGEGWLGAVPEHWTAIRYKNVFEEKAAISESQLPSGSISYGRVVFKDDEFLHEPTKASYQEVLSGEFLINPINLNYDLKSLRTALSEIDTCVSPAYIVLRPKIASDKSYLKHQLHAFDLFHMKTLGAGVRQTITFGDIGCCFTVLPPLPEQIRIAAFLDRETAKIDELVAEQRRLMELLKEKRQAVISHAVTKGLDPKVKLKPSGIEWLGDVPAHWSVRRVKTVTSFITSGPRGWSERISEGGHLFIQSGDLNDELEVEFDTAKRVQVEADAETTRTQLCAGDIVVCITGAKTGNVAVCASVPETAYVNQHLCLVRPTGEVLPLFLGVVLKSRIGQIYFELSQYGLKQGLSLEDVKEAPVFLPPAAEQKKIVELVKTETAKFDALTAEAQRAIDLLQERRTALISAAVTGQIDVRGVTGEELQLVAEPPASYGKS